MTSMIKFGRGPRYSFCRLLNIVFKSKATEFHSSARTILNSSMQYLNPSMKEALVSSMLDEKEVFEMKKILNSLS